MGIVCIVFLGVMAVLVALALFDAIQEDAPTSEKIWLAVVLFFAILCAVYVGGEIYA